MSLFVTRVKELHCPSLSSFILIVSQESQTDEFSRNRDKLILVNTNQKAKAD
jgi:hypothetical protein